MDKIAYDSDWFDRRIERRGSDSIKWAYYKDPHVLPMWVADMDFQSPPAVVDALARRLAHPVFGYGREPAALAEAVAAFLARTHGWQVDPDWIVWMPGVVTGLNAACRVVADPGAEAITLTPIYPPFFQAPPNAGVTLRRSPMCIHNDRWCIDFDHLQACIGPQTRLLMLCSPHNPTGRVFDADELTRLVDLCLANDILICSDEIHCDLVLEPGCTHLPTASLTAEAAQKIITLMAPSKTFNIPGLGCAYAIVPDKNLRRQLSKAMRGIVPEVNLLGRVAARAALTQGQDWLEGLLAYLRANRDLVLEAVRQIPQLSILPIEATYLAWIDVHRLELKDPAAHFAAHGLGLSPGSAFGDNGFVRLNFGCPRSRLRTGLQRLTTAAAQRS